MIKCKDVDKPTVDFGEYSNADCYVTPGACVCSADPSDTEICAGRCAGTGRRKRGGFRDACARSLADSNGLAAAISDSSVLGFFGH